MGWLQDKISLGKKLLEKTPSIEYLELPDLQNWLQEQEKNIIAETKLDEERLAYLQLLEAKSWQLDLKLSQWKERLCKDEMREIQPFINQIERLRSLLKFPSQPGFSLLMEQNKEIENIILKVKEVVDAYTQQEKVFLLSDGQDVEKALLNPLLEELLGLDQGRKEFEQKMVQGKLRTLDLLQSKKEFLESTTKQTMQLKKRLSLLQERLALAEQRRQEKGVEVERLKTDPLYPLYQKLEVQRKVHKQRIVQHQDEVVSFFVQLKPILELARSSVSNASLLHSYLQDPESAFLHDDSLAVVITLQEIKNQVLEKKGAFQDLPNLENEPVKAFLSTLARVEKGHLLQWRERQKELQREGATLNPLAEDRLFLFKMYEANYRLEHFSQQVNQLRQNFSESEEQLNDLEEQRMKEKELFQHLVKMGLGREVEVKL